MSLVQELMNQNNIEGFRASDVIKRFTPTEIREAIQNLIANEQNELAYALGDAGLSLFPKSEDMLAMNGLLAILRNDWPQAVEMLEDLKAIQGDQTQPFTFVMLVRALRCNLNPARALEVVREGLALYPDQLELVSEKLSLDEFSDVMVLSESFQ
ncbi:MAG: hypothetical protein EBT78_17600 [Betaproteobacteria bacterium]|jgi:hypothetical protein|nr:hypothetical protein [Betaproteobacteria bacterium]